jgi:hypothetical protein
MVDGVGGLIHNHHITSLLQAKVLDVVFVGGADSRQNDRLANESFTQPTLLTNTTSIIMAWSDSVEPTPTHG